MLRGRRSKYSAIPTVVEGYRFASKREAARYQALRLLERAKLIGELRRQPEFPLHVVRLYRNGWPISIVTVAKYVADFEYLMFDTGEIVVEDVKGMRTPLYILKRKLAEAIHGITVREV